VRRVVDLDLPSIRNSWNKDARPGLLCTEMH